MCFALSPATPRTLGCFSRLSTLLVPVLLLFVTAGTASAQSTPTNLTAKASSGQITLSWTASTFPGAYPTFVNFYAAFYRVYRSTTPGGEAGNQIAEVDDPNAGNDDTPAPSTTYTDTNVTSGVTYYYTVIAVLETTQGGGAGGGDGEDGPQVRTTESDMSNEASATLNGTVFPSAPSGLTATAGNASAVLSWTAPSGSGLTYNIKRATVSGGPYSTVGGTSGTSDLDTGLTNGTTYYYVVTAVSSAGESGNSNEATATSSGPAADFALAASPNNFGITPGGTASTVVTITPSSTFSGSVALSASGLPSGVTASFNPPAPIAVTAGTPITTTLTLTASSTASSGSLTVTAVSGALSQAAVLTLTVVPAQSTGPVNLTNVYLTVSALTNRVDWVPYNGSYTLDSYSWSRTGGGGSSGYTGTNSFLIDSAGLGYATKYVYSVTAHCYYITTDPTTHQQVRNSVDVAIGSCSVTDMQSFATDNQAIDSRFDPRYSLPTFLNHNFGSTTYRGGLFAGYIADPARVGRSLIKFSIPPLPSGQLPWRAGSVLAYAMRGYAAGTTTVSCQRVGDNWTGPTATWSTAPAISGAGNGIAIIDTGGGINAWEHWTMGTDIYSAIVGSSGMLSVGLASTNESSTSWTYFAKKEYNPALTPLVLYAYGAPN